MSNVASLELCKELYELSGWKDTFNYWEQSDGIPLGEPYLTQPELMQRYGLWGTQELKRTYPAYDLGYLLRKLPTWVEPTVKEPHLLTIQPNPTIDYKHAMEIQEADTPEDAACKLAIELFKQGILTKEGK